MKQRQGWQWSVLDLDTKGEVESNQCESVKSSYIHGKRNMAYCLSKGEMQKKETSGSWNPPLFAMMIGMMSGEKEFKASTTLGILFAHLLRNSFMEPITYTP